MPSFSETALDLVEAKLTDEPSTVREIHARVCDLYAETYVRSTLSELAKRHKAHRAVEPNTTNHIRCRYRRA